MIDRIQTHRQFRTYEIKDFLESAQIPVAEVTYDAELVRFRVLIDFTFVSVENPLRRIVNTLRLEPRLQIENYFYNEKQSVFLFTLVEVLGDGYGRFLAAIDSLKKEPFVVDVVSNRPFFTWPNGIDLTITSDVDWVDAMKSNVIYDLHYWGNYVVDIASVKGKMLRVEGLSPYVRNQPPMVLGSEVVWL